jgi:hypothetical protein
MMPVPLTNLPCPGVAVVAAIVTTRGNTAASAAALTANAIVIDVAVQTYVHDGAVVRGSPIPTTMYVGVSSAANVVVDSADVVTATAAAAAVVDSHVVGMRSGHHSPSCWAVNATVANYLIIAITTMYSGVANSYYYQPTTNVLTFGQSPPKWRPGGS